MNPILKYPGSKWRLADWIIDHQGAIISAENAESALEDFLQKE